MRKSRLPVETHSRGLSTPAASAFPSPTNTPTLSTTKRRQKRHSIMSIASLKPARGKLQKLWPTTSPPTESPSSSPSECKDWSRSDLSAVVRLGLGVSTLGNPANPITLRSPDDSLARDGAIERSRVEDAVQPMTVPPPSRAPPPPPPLSAPRPPYSLHRQYSSPLTPPLDVVTPPCSPSRQCPPHAVLPPDRAPPPPPFSAPRPPSPHRFHSPSLAPPSDEVPRPPSPSHLHLPRPVPTHLPSELSPVNYDVDDEDHALDVPPRRPSSIFRRRAKTPVHQIGQLERAARRSRQVTSGFNRMSSVSTIARQYRELVVSDDDLDDVQHPDGHVHDFRGPQTPEEHRRSTSLESANYSWRHSQLTPSLVSDDGTLVALEEELVEDVCKSAAWSALPSPPLSKDIDEGADEDAMPAPDAFRFSVGLDLLTRELSSAMADQSKRDGRDASGLQVWVMIEAYERLQHQIAASGPGNEGAKEAIDSWLKALHAIHRDLADEAAMSESEYGE